MAKAVLVMDMPESCFGCNLCHIDDGEEKRTGKVNNFIQNLKEKGTTEITLDITTTGKGIVYTLIW